MIIGNLDEDGYIRVSLDELAKDADCSLDQIERVLRQIQTLDPVGVGARDLQECLLIQLEHLKQEESGLMNHCPAQVSPDVVAAILKDHLVDLQKKRYQAVEK